jgi:hypothetical protein
MTFTLDTFLTMLRVGSATDRDLQRLYDLAEKADRLFLAEGGAR